MSDQSRVCVTCGTEKPLTGFYSRRIECKSCFAIAYKKLVQSCPEEYLRKSWTRLKTYRKKQGYCVDLAVDELTDIFKKQQGMCAVTDLVMTFHPEAGQSRGTNASIDRIDNDAGYTKDNVRLVCSRINLMRGNQNDGDLYWWAKTLVNKFDE